MLEFDQIEPHSGQVNVQYCRDDIPRSPHQGKQIADDPSHLSYSPQRQSRHRSHSPPARFIDGAFPPNRREHYCSRNSETGRDLLSPIPQHSSAFSSNHCRSWEGSSSAPPLYHGHDRMSSRRTHGHAVSHAPLDNPAPHHYSYHPGQHMSLSQQPCSSFESYGNLHNQPYPPPPHHHHHHHPPHAVPHPQYVVSGPLITYPYGSHHPMPPPGSFYSPWGGGPPPPKPIEYICDIQPTDVLCGRGGATNSHSGNQSFRSLVKRHQSEYLKAKKRDKPAVASVIVEAIRGRGGRFLRRSDSVNRQGDVLWVDIGDDRAREKTCQALREGAPELRRQRRRKRNISASPSPSEDNSDDDNSDDDDDGAVDENDHESPKKKANVSHDHAEDDDDDDDGGSHVKKERISLKSNQVTDKRVEYHDENEDKNHAQVFKQEESYLDSRDDDDDDDVLCHDFFGVADSAVAAVAAEEGSIVLRPCSRLMGHATRDVPLSEFSLRDQQLYLDDFFPPDDSMMSSPTLHKRERRHGHEAVAAAAAAAAFAPDAARARAASNTTAVYTQVTANDSDLWAV